MQIINKQLYIMDKNNKIQVSFSAINKKYEENIPQFVEKEGIKEYILYGEDNQLPEYLYGLYNEVSTLRTIIEGTSDYVLGNDIKCNVSGFNVEVNQKGDTLREIIKLISRDYLLYGGYALQIIRNKIGDVREIYYLDFKNVRTSKKNDVIYYSEEFGKKYVRTNKTVRFPKFVAEDKTSPTSVLYVKNEKTKTYPIPRYSGALKSIEIERQISDYHLSALENGFNGSYIINFLNGVPDDEVKWEIEKNVSEKFCGSKNAGRILLNFANGKDNATTIDKLDVEDFGTKYESLNKWSKEQIFTAFQCSPIIFGSIAENKGFSRLEFTEAFELYNKTIVYNIQQMIIDNFDKIFGIKNSIEIIPFSLEK